MTTLAERVDPLELDLQSPGSTGFYYYASVLSHLDRVSRCAFASATTYSTWSAKVHGYANAGLVGMYESTDPVANPPSTADAILTQVDELKTWLNVSYDDLAGILGWQSASNFYYWRRCARMSEPVQPRAATVEPILRLHALVRAVSDTISGDDPAAVQLWARTPMDGDAFTPLDLLQHGRVADVERIASHLLFDQSTSNREPWRLYRPMNDGELPEQPQDQGYGPEDFG